jgi:hypothetical protein
LHFDEGSNGVQILRDLAESCLAKGELERGLQMLTALLHHAPEDVWTYNLIAISFDRFGLTQIGEQAIQRGLQLLDAKGDKERLRQQFERCKIDMQNSSLRGREAEISPKYIDALQDALNLDFDAGQPRPIAQLCLELVPDLDRITVKRPLTSAQMPLPDSERALQLLSQLKVPTQKKRTRRRRRKSKHSDA